MKTIIEKLIQILKDEVKFLESKLPIHPFEIPSICGPNEVSRGTEKLNLLDKIGKYLELNNTESINNPFYYWSEYKFFIENPRVEDRKKPSGTEQATFYRSMITLLNGDNFAINESLKARKQLIIFLNKLLEINLDEQKNNKNIWLIIK